MIRITVFTQALDWAKRLYADLAQSKPLGYLLMLSAAIAVLSGLLLFLIDANIHSPLDGIWSAWVTMTHVGFGDVVPVSLLGRLLSAGLILLGAVVFSLFTALISAALVNKTLDSLGGGVRALERDSDSVLSAEQRILKEIAELRLQVERLQQMARTAPPDDNPQQQC